MGKFGKVTSYCCLQTCKRCLFIVAKVRGCLHFFPSKPSISNLHFLKEMKWMLFAYASPGQKSHLYLEEKTRDKKKKTQERAQEEKNVAGGAEWPGGVTCWDRLRGVYGGKGCCKWNLPSLRRFCCCRRLIKVVNKYTQTCRRTFLGGVLAHSPLPRPPAGLEQDVSRGAAPDIPVGELKYREFSLLRATLLLGWEESAPKGKGFLTGGGLASRQSQTSLL